MEFRLPSGVQYGILRHLTKMDRQHIGEQGKVLLSELECRMIECVAHFKDGAQVQNNIEVNM